MNQYLKPNERELIKLVKFFSKRAEQLMLEGTLSEDNKQLTDACENLTTMVYKHAEVREQITNKREKLKAIIKDNATCPKCGHNTHLKLVGTARHEKGWKTNKYKCRRCNIEFLWGKPNNPWDMVIFLEQYIQEMHDNVQNEALDQEIRDQSEAVIENLEQSLNQLRPILQGSDEEMQNLEEKEIEMSKMIHQFKNYLLIEKIKLDTWQDPSTTD